MKLLLLIGSVMLSGCANTVLSTAYSATSTGTWAVTGKSFTDRAVEQIIPHSDCSVWNIIDRLHYCEIQDPGQTYNRSAI